MIRLELPYPISANRYWFTRVDLKTKPPRAYTFPSTEAQAYKKQIAWLAVAAGIRQPLAGPIEVTLELYPHLPKDWAKRAKDDPEWWDLTVQCIDLDNARKVLWDALKGVAFTDDRMIRKDPGEIMVPDGEARVVVTIRPYERPHPQKALFAREPVYVPPVRREKRAKKAKPETSAPAPHPSGVPF